MLTRHFQFFKISALTLLLLIISLQAQAQKKVCITIDDLPVVGYGFNKPEEWKSVTQKLITHFKEEGIPAIGYVNEHKLYTNGQLNQERLAILELWLSNGYELGNHTYDHMDYHKSSFEDFTANIIDGEKITRPLMEKYQKSLQYFRHPFLRAGNTQQTSEALEGFLKDAGYTPAPVTLDSDDYLFAKAYAGAFRKGEKDLMKKIGDEYISHTENKLQFYEKLTEKVFGRQIAQTYLCHANMLNADYLDELAEMFKRNGYEFVSQTDVLKDKAYQEPVTKFGNWGVSWLYRWALSRDKGKALFKVDIEVPAYIQELAK
ncbi:MAG: polysaccharide deacetylase family protein [Roseivirga sp.]|nr:polysaccharide deacetylase family protein [Roseivirga sp.]